MAETLSIAPRIARLITLSTAILAASSNFLSGKRPQDVSHAVIQQDVLQDWEQTLHNIRDCGLISAQCRKKAVGILLWPIKQKDIIKNSERLGRLCASLHIAISIKSAFTLRTLGHEQ